MRLLGFLVVAAFATLAASCASRTGDQTIADYCADPGRANYDICKQHSDIEGVRLSLGQRIGEVMGVAQHAQTTADQAMTRQMTCSTRTVRRSATGSCENGATLTSCTQTRYTTRAGGMAILRSISDTECRFNGRVLEMQVRCCTVGAPVQQTMQETPAPQSPAPPRPTS
ncbi:MAG: hypothetical protein AB7L65_07815 [Hyphomonadaceae bacterium]